MEKQSIDEIDVLWGFGNVYADLVLLNAEKLKIKTSEVNEIRKAMHT